MKLTSQWAVILGASSGFGEAVAKRLAKDGINIFGIHMDRKQGMPNVERIIGEIEKAGARAKFFNGNAADPEKRDMVVQEIKKVLNAESGSRIRVVLHSLAFGTLKKFIHENTKDEIRKDQLEMTIDVMGSSLVYWSQALNREGLLREGAQIYAMTSAGGQRVWPTYGAVSAAKAALESNIRQLAMEFAPQGIMVNAILAGVTDTPALRKIPGHERMLEMARNRNPFKRLTIPDDIADVISCFAKNLSHSWLTGNVIRVDGGENIVD